MITYKKTVINFIRKLARKAGLKVVITPTDTDKAVFASIVEENKHRRLIKDLDEAIKKSRGVKRKKSYKSLPESTPRTSKSSSKSSIFGRPTIANKSYDP